MTLGKKKYINKEKAKEKIFYFLCFGIFFLLSSVLVSQCLAENGVCFKEHCFKIEIADDDQERQQGLMFRESLPQDQGMLFVFPIAQKYSFWMKNTLIPLDIIWLDNGMQVVHIEENVSPCKIDPCQSYGPLVEADYVLELNAGMVEKIGLKLGDQWRAAKIDH